MKTLKKYISSILLWIFLFVMVLGSSQSILVSNASTGILTRGQWIHNLVTTFDMTLDDTSLPDNYYADIKEGETYYNDIMLAVGYGVIDLEAGKDFEPDKAVTREFAVHTLNFCLGYQLDELSKYTFSDYNDCVYPDDDQIALNRGWLEMSGGKFMPQQTLTESESANMLDDAIKVLADTVVDTGHENVWNVKQGVIEVPKDVTVEVDSDVVMITDCPVTINNGDIFVVYQGEVAVPYKAMSVSAGGNVISIKKEDVEYEEAFTDIEAEGIIDPDNLVFEPADGVELTDLEEDTAAFNGRAVTKIKNKKFEKSFKLSNGVTATVKGTIKNIRAEFQVISASNKAFAKVSGDISITDEIKVVPASLGSASLEIVNIGIPGLGGLTVNVELKTAGKMSATVNQHVEIGISYSKNEGIRTIRSFKENGGSNSTISAEASLGIRARLGITDLKVISGYVYAEAGITGKFVDTVYTDGQKPINCRTFLAYLYVNYGARAGCVFLDQEYKNDVEVYNLKNSPIRVYRHYEDGSEVPRCARGETLEYFTKHYSKYFGTGWSEGFGKYGYDDAGEPYQIYEYTLESNNATITKYYGNAPYVVIPEKLDGYTVVTIGANAFEKNNSIVNVVIPDTVTKIQKNSFAECSNLQQAVLSKNAVFMGTNVFKNCSLLNNIEIPKSLETCDANDFSGEEGGPFNACLGLKNVTFEKGIKKIPLRLFYRCTGLEKIVIPYGVTDIEWRAFMDCKNLQKIDLPNSLTNMGCYCFSGCPNLKEVKLPEGLHKMGDDVFSNCAGLEEVTIPKSLEEIYWDNGFFSHLGPFGNDEKLKTVHFDNGINRIANSLFQDCSGIEEIVLPETIKTIDRAAFNNCKNLRAITLNEGLQCIDFGAFKNCATLQKVYIPDSVITMGVGSTDFINDKGIFENCSSLTEVHIPNKSVIIREETFSGCSSLIKINFPETLKLIGSNAFRNCTSLLRLDLPKQVSSIGSRAFYGCTSLTMIKLPEEMRTIESGAFFGCESLEQLKIDEGTNMIGNSAFEGCKSLAKVKLPDTLQSLGNSAFANCELLEDISLGAGLRELPDKAFFQDSALKEIVLPQQMTKVGSQVFVNCTSLTDITLNRNIMSVSKDAFSYPDRITIYGVSGTYPETYAKEQEILFVELNVPATDLLLSKDSCKIGRGNSINLTASISPVNSSDELIWTSEDESIVTVDKTGLLKGVKTGTTNIVAMIGNIIKICEVTVYEPVTRVSLNATEKDMSPGETFQLEASVSPSYATNKNVTWSSGDENIATVNEAGLVKAISFGTTEVTVTTEDQNKTAVCKINVKPIAVTGITIDKQNITMKEGMTYQLQVVIIPENAANQKVEWSSSDPEIVSVENGLLTAIKDGSAIIVVKTEDGGKTAICNVKVSDEIETEPPQTSTLVPSPTVKPDTNQGSSADNLQTDISKNVTTSTNNQKVKVTPPAKVKIKSAKNKRGRKLLVKWAKLKGVKGYQIQYSKNKNFKGKKSKIVKKTSVTLKRLTKKKKYYIRIRAYKINGSKKVYGKWSSIKRVKITK